MKVEQAWGFDKALDVDTEVWKVMPKIQARKLKQFCGLEKGLDALLECFTTKLSLEGFEFTTERSPAGDIQITLSACPWVQLLAGSNRLHLAARIGQRICDTEYGVWASEFGSDISVEFQQRICTGCPACRIRFWQSSVHRPPCGSQEPSPLIDVYRSRISPPPSEKRDSIRR